MTPFTPHYKLLFDCFIACERPHHTSCVMLLCAIKNTTPHWSTGIAAVRRLSL